MVSSASPKVAHQFYDSIRGKELNKTKVIVSSHNYQYTPSAEDLANLVAEIQATGADIVKFATTALDITDVARIFQITAHSQVRHVCKIFVLVRQDSLIDRYNLINFKNDLLLLLPYHARYLNED